MVGIELKTLIDKICNKNTECDNEKIFSFGEQIIETNVLEIIYIII